MRSSESLLTKIENLDIFIGDGNYAGKYPKANELLDHGVPFISAKDFNGRLFSDVDMRYISKELHSKLLKGHTKHNDILIVVRGNGVGKVSLVPKKYSDCNLNAQLALLRPNSDYINPKYLYYLLSSDKYYKMFNDYSSGSAQPQLTISAIKKVPVKIVPKKIQDEIANILSSLDDKIELNNKINKNLEELAQTLYKRWFVDFEFPNEDGEPYKSSGGEMVDSEFGTLPKGWIITDLGDICITVLGGTPSRGNPEYWNGSINWINSGEINKVRIIEPSEKITKLGLDKSSTKLMPKKTTVIAITGATLGAVSLLEIESCANQSVIGIYENDNIPYSYIYALIKDRIHDLIGRQTGGAQQHINKNDVNSLKIIVPEHNLLKKFHFILSNFHDEIANRMFQNKYLSKLRDELLPKLMNGEIEVPIKE